MDYPFKDKITQYRKEARCAISLALDKMQSSGQSIPYDVIKIIHDIFYQDIRNHYVSISLEDPYKISYAQNQCDKYDHTRRRKTTLQRYLIRNTDILDVISESNINELVKYFWAAARPTSEFSIQLLKGDEIISAYCDEIGQSTCMTGNEYEYTEELLELYAYNTNQIQLVVYNDQFYTGRALLWTTDNSIICLDRIYPNEGQHVQQMQQYAINNRWATRCHNRLPDDNDSVLFSVFAENTNSTFSTASLEVTFSSVPGKFPYLDSFRYGFMRNRKLVLTCDYNKAEFICNSEEGEVEEIPHCDSCGDTLMNGAYNDSICESCYNDMFDHELDDESDDHT